MNKANFGAMTQMGGMKQSGMAPSGGMQMMGTMTQMGTAPVPAPKPASLRSLTATAMASSTGQMMGSGPKPSGQFNPQTGIN